MDNQKRFRDSVYVKEHKFDHLSKIPNDETGRERRLREKSEKKLLFLVNIYHNLKEQYVKVDECKLIFPNQLVDEMEKLGSEWETYCNIMYDQKCRDNPDPTSLPVFMATDMQNAIKEHWTNVLDGTLKKYKIKSIQGFDLKVGNKKVSETIYDIVIFKKLPRHFKIWEKTTKNPYMILFIRSIIIVFKIFKISGGN